VVDASASITAQQRVVRERVAPLLAAHAERTHEQPVG